MGQIDLRWTCILKWVSCGCSVTTKIRSILTNKRGVRFLGVTKQGLHLTHIPRPSPTLPVMTTHAQDPLKKARLISLAVAWVFAVIAACVGLNALIKSNQDKSKLKQLAPPPTVVFIDTNGASHDTF
jgi:hypothetical protein